MKKLLLTFAAGCLLAAGTNAALAQGTIYDTSFEAPTFSLGDLDGQDGWSVDEGTAEIASGPLTAADGSQYLAQGENSEVSRAISGTGSDLVLFRGSYYGTGSNTLVVPDVEEPVAVLLGFRRINDSTFTIAAYDGVTEQYVEPSPAITFSNTEWAQITALIDYDTKTYSLSVNNEPYLLDVNFADDSAASLGGFKSLSASASNSDALGFFSTDGDFDGDGIPDAVEIATPGLDPFTPNFPEASLTLGGSAVVPNGTYDLGVGSQGGAPLTATIVVSNDAPAPLNVEALTIDAPFTLNVGPDFTIDGNSSADLVVTLPSGTIGDFSGELSFEHNDPSQPSPFVVTITGEITDAPPVIPGDFNEDGCVNILDFFELVDNWQNPYTILDFFDLVDNWQQGCN